MHHITILTENEYDINNKNHVWIWNFHFAYNLPGAIELTQKNTYP